MNAEVMHPFVFFLIFALIFIIVGIFAAISWYRKLKKIREFAQAHGYTYTELDEFNVMGRCSGFPMFNIGDSRKVYAQIFGVYRGYSFCIFFYRYSTGSGKNRTTHHIQGVLIEAKISLPGLLTMRPEGFFDRIAEVIGFDDIDFEYNEFNKKYFIKSEDKRMAYDIYGRDMMEYLLMLPRPLNLEALGPHFVFSYNHTVPFEFFERLLDTGVEFFNKLDKITVEKYGLSLDSKKYSQAFYDAGKIGAKTKGFFGR